MNSMVIVLNPLHTFIILSIIGCLTAFLAKKRGRSPIGWFLIGAFLGLIGLVMLLLLPNRAIKQETSLGEEKEPNIPAVERKPLAPFWYFLLENGTYTGPMSVKALKDQFQSGKVASETYVWSEVMSDWKKIADLPDLLETLSEPPAPAIEPEKEEIYQN